MEFNEKEIDKLRITADNNKNNDTTFLDIRMVFGITAGFLIIINLLSLVLSLGSVLNNLSVNNNVVPLNIIMPLLCFAGFIAYKFVTKEQDKARTEILTGEQNKEDLKKKDLAILTMYFLNIGVSISVLLLNLSF